MVLLWNENFNVRMYLSTTLMISIAYSIVSFFKIGVQIKLLSLVLTLHCYLLSHLMCIGILIQVEYFFRLPNFQLVCLKTMLLSFV